MNIFATSTPGSSTQFFVKDARLEKGISCSQHSYFLRGLSAESLAIVPRQVSVQTENPTVERAKSISRKSSVGISLSGCLSLLSLERPATKNGSAGSMELRPAHSIVDANQFLEKMNLSEEELVRSRKNLTKNWVFRVKQIILTQDLLAYHDHCEDVAQLRKETQQCNNRVNEISQLFVGREWLADYFDEHVFHNGSFQKEILNNPRLTNIGKFMMLQSVGAFKFGMRHPERFTSWSLEKMENPDQMLEAPIADTLNYSQVMDKLKRMTQNEPNSVNKKDGSENLTRYWVIAIKHLLESSESDDLMRVASPTAFKNCLRLLKKCCSIPKLKLILEKNLWLRRFLLSNDSSHLLMAVWNDKKINQKSKKKLLQTFPILIAGVEDLNKLSKWSDQM